MSRTADFGAATAGDRGAPRLDVNTAVITPTDRVRWGPIWAGLFAALSALAVLTVLGIAVAGAAYDPGDSRRAFGIGAGVWGAVSMLIAFFLGGWLAARTAAVGGRRNGLLNGAMVWAVAIPLMIYLVAGGLARVADVASTAAGSAAQAVDRPSQAGEDLMDQAQRTMGNAQARAGDPVNQERAADATQRAAWGTLVSMLLGLAAAAVGGYLGARTLDDDDDTNRRGRVQTT